MGTAPASIRTAIVSAVMALVFVSVPPPALSTPRPASATQREVLNEQTGTSGTEVVSEALRRLRKVRVGTSSATLTVELEEGAEREVVVDYADVTRDSPATSFLPFVGVAIAALLLLRLVRVAVLITAGLFRLRPGRWRSHGRRAARFRQNRGRGDID